MIAFIYNDEKRRMYLQLFKYVVYRLSRSVDVHRLHPGSSEPVPAAARSVRPTGHGDVQPPPPWRDHPTHLCHRQRMLPLAVEEATEPMHPDQVCFMCFLFI